MASSCYMHFQPRFWRGWSISNLRAIKESDALWLRELGPDARLSLRLRKSLAVAQNAALVPIRYGNLKSRRSGCPVDKTERTAGRIAASGFPAAYVPFPNIRLALAEHRKPLKSNCPIFGFPSSMGLITLVSREHGSRIAWWFLLWNLNCAREPFPALADIAA